ncbi:hypothetical protein HMPREF9727_00684 [Treponema denticola MYR-T]|jgi:hypothetical protein|uniref:Uncharacterized protein n=3 Tax=Treponema denticola TaxID=158 RepID=M2C3Q4_TREDN|nr:DUF6506 family protein [Treponema denticola]EGC77969.1 hypothetical protein HMPREF9353_00816 [Treponema denticola F0402]EMB23757.1 hypothetical protein HMPREF9723_00895 [Treponema denticola OTK]EMB30999.1 hypothetical protein HMPREF9727_00684 [Treponema denticola MYR-T]EMB31927.1 hypothetical protein HMPREF9725_01049 [Treponema denticola H1-T]EMB33798.1 hypothetical protein HMPREF9726_01178 [Treponema denticola H-22]
MKFAFLILGDFNEKTDRALIHGGSAQIIGVADMEEAVHVAKELCTKGIGCIELCGAFGEKGARRIIEATGNTIPIGYITHLAEQDGVYKAAFSN